MTGWIDPDNYGPHSRQYLGHSFRYFLAAGFLSVGDTVMDAACGVGYGSAILGRYAHRVNAYDNDDEALAIARQKHGDWNIRFQMVDLSTDDDLDECDVAVSFETIEHLDNPVFFVGNVKACTRHLIILSAPVVPTVGVNPHHKHDFTEQQLLSLILDDNWTLWEQVRQGPYLIVVAYKGEPR